MRSTDRMKDIARHKKNPPKAGFHPQVSEEFFFFFLFWVFFFSIFFSAQPVQFRPVLHRYPPANHARFLTAGISPAHNFSSDRYLAAEMNRHLVHQYACRPSRYTRDIGHNWLVTLGLTKAAVLLRRCRRFRQSMRWLRFSIILETSAGCR